MSWWARTEERAERRRSFRWERWGCSGIIGTRLMERWGCFHESTSFRLYRPAFDGLHGRRGGTVKSAEPADGAVLDRSPPSIAIKFEHAVQMTSVSVVAEHAAKRELTFAAVSGGTVITVENPALATGRNEIHWKALSKDGHVISGKLTYTIKPAIAGS